MNTRLRQLILTAGVLLTAFAAVPAIAPAQPRLPTADYVSGEQVGMHLFLPSRFIRSIEQDRLQFARIRTYGETYLQAVECGEYARALAIADSLIGIAEKYSVQGVHFTRCYQNRAQMLKALHRDAEACRAYDRAVQVRDSVMRLEQSQTLHEMQASYELDRLTLDRALHSARHHKTVLILLALLLVAAAAVVVFIYADNRRMQRLHDELRRQMDQARRSEEKKIAFINSMCHEVRTPLNSIAGFSELLCADDITPEAHAQYGEIIQQSRQQLRYLFDDMLEVAYLENLGQPLPHGYMDLCALCRTRLRVMKVRYAKPGVEYRDEIPNEEIGVNSNEKYLGMLIAALLNNAVKFTAQGSVCLACSRTDDDRVTISVTDTGCGIPPAEYAHVFERFTKLDPFSQGNGLGLYLCRLIACRLGGSIRIDTAYTAGTRIEVTIPRKPIRG